MTMPFSMTRKGEAHIEAPPASAAVASDLEGTWSGVIAASIGEVHVLLYIANTGDGHSSAYLVNQDQGGIRLPLVVSRDHSAVTLTSTVVASGFTGTLDVFAVPAAEKQEVLAAFAAHKGEVNTGYLATGAGAGA